MTTPSSPPKTWAKASVAWSKPHFGSQVHGCTSVKHLRKAVHEEATSKARKERIAMLNKRIDTVQNTDYE